jgi:hypothetical protein
MQVERKKSRAKKKAGLVGPVSRGVELDAVTSQRGANWR